MSNPFDQFDAPAAEGGNPFDQFDAPAAKKLPSKGILSDVGGAFVEGAKSAGRAIAGTANIYAGDESALVEKAQAQESAQAQKPAALTAFNQAVTERVKPLGDDPGLLDSVKAIGGAVVDQPKGAGLAVVEQLPNAAPAIAGGMAGMKAGAALGTAIMPGVGTTIGAIGGGLAGMFLGNTAIETGYKGIEAAQDGAVTQDEMSRVKKEGAVKAGVITGVDALTLGLSKAVTNIPARAVESATRNALTKAGVNVADEAAVLAARQSPEISAAVRAAQESAFASANTLGKRAAAGGAALGLETVGEGLGEYLGELAATGKANVADAVLEAMMSLGQSGAEVAWGAARNKKAEQGGMWDTAEAKFQPPPPTLVTEPEPLQQRIDALMGIDTGAMSDKERTQYEKDLTAAFLEPVGVTQDEHGLEIPFTMADYLNAQVRAEDSVRARPLKQNAADQSGNRLQQLADEETQQQPDIPGYVAPEIPVVGTLSAMANMAIQSGAHKQSQMQQAMQAAVEKQKSTSEGSSRAAQPEQMAAQAPQANDAQAPAFDVSTRTEGQLSYLAQNGQPGWKEAATAEIQRRGVQISQAQQSNTDAIAPSAMVNPDAPAANSASVPALKASDSAKAPEIQNGDGVTNLPTEKRGIKTIDRWSAEELQGRLDRGNLSPESEQRLRAELAKRQPVKQSAPQASPLTVGKTPNGAEPVTVRNGVVHVGDYPAIDYETEADITVPEGATPQQIADALRKGGAIGSNKIFGLKAEESASQEKPAVEDPIGWTRMTKVEREALVARAGWAGKIRGMNLGGVRVATQAWDAMTEANRAKLIEANQNPIKNEAPDAATIPAETKSPESEPIKKDFYSVPVFDKWLSENSEEGKPSEAGSIVISESEKTTKIISGRESTNNIPAVEKVVYRLKDGKLIYWDYNDKSQSGSAVYVDDADSRLRINAATPAAVDSVSQQKIDATPEAAQDKAPESDADSRFAKNTIFTADKVAAARARLKSKLGTMNSGIDPELLVDGMTIAGAYIESGVRKFGDYAKAMVADLGEGVKPYLLSFYEAARAYPGLNKLGMDTQEAAAAQHQALLTPEANELPDLMTEAGKFTVAKEIADYLIGGDGFKTIIEARKKISSIIGKPIEAATELAKQADEAIETAVVMAGREIVKAGRAQNRSNVVIYDRLVDLYRRQPNLAVRSSTSVRDQAYSTPVPLAYLASELAGITYETSVYEPTAGNGMLLVGAAADNVVANELNPKRAAMIRALMPEANVRENNGAEWRPDAKVDAVIANPPFGAVKDGNGETVYFSITPEYDTRELDHAIVFKALESLKDNGRAVLIVGGVQSEAEEARREDYRGKNKRQFYFNLYNNFNVIDHFTADGDLYSKQGASYPVDVIVINGRGKSNRDLPAADLPKIIKSYEELKEKLNVANRMEPAGSDTARTGRSNDQGRGGDAQGLAGNPVGSSQQNGDGGRQRSDSAGVSNAGRSDNEQSAGGRPVSSGGQLESSGTSDGGNGNRVSDKGRAGRSDAGRNAQGNRSNDLGGTSVVDGQRVESGLTDRRGQEQETGHQVSYSPHSNAPAVGTLVPRAMRDAIASSLSKISDQVGDIDNYVAESLDMDPETVRSNFSAEQIDALALSIRNAEAGKGFIIGDQTGIGKGRVVAAMIRYALVNGKTPIFVTEKPNLYSDMIRDLDDIGMTDELGLDTKSPRILITNGGESIPYTLLRNVNGEVVENNLTLRAPKAGKALDDLMQSMVNGDDLGDYKVIFTTYSQLQTVKGKQTTRQRFVSHFGASNYMIFDESHNAGGAGETQARTKEQRQAAKDGQSLVTGRAAFVRGLVQKAFGTFFSSATYAKRPDVMDLYSSTNMKLAVDRISQLGDAIKSGGVPMQQVVANMLTQDGQYIRRERTFAGVDYNTKETVVDQQTAENMASAMRSILAFSRAKEGVIKQMQKEFDKQGAMLAAVGGESTSVQGANFGSIMHNLIDQMLLSLKAKSSVDHAIERLKAGEKVVMTVSNTMGSFLKDYADEFGVMAGDPVALSFSDLYVRYLEKQRIVSIKAGNGEKRQHRLTDAELGPTLVDLFNKVRKQIDESGFGSAPISPIDYMHAELRKAGYKTDEITGRTITLNYHGETPVLASRSANIKQRVGAVSSFNNGDTDVLILNQAGSTGLSLHASSKFKDKRKRHMIIVQAEKNIDTHMQMLGRVHRTGQVIAPAYSQMMADIPAEMRPASVLLKKMASLNANTTASRKSSVTAEGVVDFMNDYGGQVVHEYLRDNPDVLEAVGGPDVMKLTEDSEDGNEDDIRKFTGYVPILPIKMQEEIYRDLIDRYNDLIERENSLGTNKLEAKAVDLDAETLSAQPITEKKEEQSAFASPAVMEKVDVKRSVKPYSSEEVAAIVKERLGDKTAREIASEQKLELRDKASAFARERIAKMQADGADPIKVDMHKSQLNLIYSHTNSILDTYSIGDPVSIKDQNGQFLYGVVTDIQTNGKTANPAAGSAWKMTFAIANGDAKSITMNFSQLGSKYEVRAANIVDWYNIETQSAERVPLMSLFDKGATVRREKRWIITGNLLAGYSRLPGQIITYTKKDGTSAQGILMSRQFDFEKEMKNAPVLVKSGAEAVKLFNGIGNGASLGTKDRSLMITDRNGRYELTVPSSKKDGGTYFLDQGITDIVGDLYKRGSIMSANVYGDNMLGRLVNYLINDRQEVIVALAQPEKAKQILRGEQGPGNIAERQASLSAADKAIYGMAAEGKSAAEVLKFIASASRSPFNRQVAKLLMKTGIAPSVTVGDGKGWKMNAGEGNKYAAGYNPKTDTISLFRPASSERNMLHELIHAATLKALSKKGMASAQMNALYQHVKKSGKLKGMYGMSDVDEFIAEAFSNPKFQAALKQVAAPSTSTAKSAWHWFVRVIKGILGLPSGSENALSQALEIGIGVMRENMRLNEGAGDVRYNAAPGKINQTDTEAFRKWFGDSRVVDADGKPMRVYHGTGATDIGAFNVSDRGSYGGGIYLTPEIRGANDYAIYRGAPSSTVYPVYAAIKNPASGSEAAQVASWKGEENAREELIRRGFDGVVDMRSGEIVAFYPEQIKSAIGNNGDFDATNPDIRYNVADEGGDIGRIVGDSVSDQLKAAVLRLSGRPMLDHTDPFAAENARLREQDQSLWSKAKKQLRRYLAPGGLLPQSVFAEKIKRDSEFQAVEFDVRHLIGGLEQAVKADFGIAFDKLSKEQMRPITEALAGKVPASLPEATKTAAVAMRQYIDGMSTEYLKIIQQKIDAKMLKALESGKDSDKAQAINEIELFEKIKGNIGRYVHRSYQAFDDPKWFEKVPAHVLNASRLYLKQGYMEAGENDAKASQMAEVTLHEILKNGTAYDSMESFIAESKLGAKDLSVLMRRKEVPAQIRALLGEYPDARLNFTKSATKMGRLIWNTRFLDRVRDMGMGSFFFEGKDRPANATTQIAADGSEVYAPLNGLWTFPEIAQSFKDALGKEQMSDLYRAIVRFNGLVKYGKTVLAPTTAMRNWQSAMFFSLANGHFDLTQMKKSISAFREQVSQKATGQDLKYLRHLKQLGVVYDTPYAGEMARLMEDARMEELLSSDKGDAVRWFRKANQLAQGFYTFGDDFWKIIGFENEKAGLMKAGLSLQEAETEAAKRIRDTYPTYSMVGRGVQWLSRFPLAGTFVSFPAEIIRTSGNMLRTVAADLKSDNPKLRELGMKRAAGMVFVSAAFYSLAALSMAMAGVGDDEDEAIRDLAPEWQKNSTFLYLGRDEKGNLRYFDMSFLDPYGYWKRPITAMLRNQPWEDSLASGLRGMLEPFIGADIAAKAIFEAVANQKENGGKVYKEKDGAINQTIDVADHLRKALQPGVVGNVERLVKAAGDVRKSSGQPYSMEDELVALVGWRATTIDPKTALYYRSFEFTDAVAEARKTITETLRDANEITPEDIADAKARAQAKQEQAFKEMHRLVSAAESAGMSKMQIVQTLRLSNISQANIGSLMRGETPDVSITPQLAARAVRQASQMRGPEYAAEVFDRYRQARAN